MKKFYITTAIPYVNAAPHIGHALEFIQADTIARYHRLLGEKTCLLSGGDENALKNVQAAEKAHEDIQTFIDKNAKLFQVLAQKLFVQFDVFQKGSDKDHHFKSSQELWRRCEKNGDIYKKSYGGLYCVGCETFYTPDELDEKGECFEHPGKKLDKVSEINYFFRLSKYQKRLVKLISSDKLKIVPQFRENEVLSFLKQPLKDISISRSNERAKNWGVPVPGDNTQRIYVWFDALNIYQSGIGFGWDEKNYQKWWPADVHVIGKGITRFHAVYWPAFLLSAGLKLPKTIFAHGYITVEGQKMSKTLGNVIDPFYLVEKYGTDPLRYYFLREIPAHDDGDFSERRFKEIYNADLANGLGNLIARVAKLAEGLTFPPDNSIKFIHKIPTNPKILTKYSELMEKYEFDQALKLLWGNLNVVNKYIESDKPGIRDIDQYVNNQQPWKLEGQKKFEIIRVAVNAIRYIGIKLKPFLPQTAEKILKQFKGPEIKSQPPLFPRLS